MTIKIEEISATRLLKAVDGSDLVARDKNELSFIVMCVAIKGRGRPKRSNIRSIQKVVNVALKVENIMNERRCNRSSALYILSDGLPQQKSTLAKYERAGRRLQAEFLDNPDIDSKDEQIAELIRIMRKWRIVPRDVLAT